MARARPLPLATSELLGRGAEVAAISADLLGRGRLVVVTGPPGVGKTRLALEVAATLADGFADGVAWVDLVPLRDPALVIDEIAHCCGLPHAAALEDRETLVVLDNCEHLLDAAPAVIDLLAEHPGVRVLATSRERLHVAAEHEWPLGPLPLPDLEMTGDLRTLATNAAVSLVLARAPAYLDLTPRTAQPLVEIIRRLDGLPLALEFAASRLRVFTPGELAFRLRDRTDDLVGTPRDAPERHRDLRAAIAWSHDLLPDAERAVFRRLSVFEGSWTTAEAEAVCGPPDLSDVVGGLESLLDKSLVRRVLDEDGQARFAMLVSLREYAAEQLELSGEGPAVRGRHARWFAEVARVWEATIGTGSENLARHRSRLARSDLELAHAHAVAHDAEATLWLGAGLGWYWYTRGSPVHAEALAPRATDVTAASPEAVSAALVAAGAVALATGDLAAAEQRLTAGLERCVARGDRRRTAIATAFLGHVDRELGRHDGAAAHYRRARAIYVELGNPRGGGWAVCDLGLLAAERGDLEAAEQLLREALDLFETLDYPWAVAVASCGLAVLLARRGDAEGAARCAGRAYALHGDAGDVRGVAQSLEALAEVALARGAAATAARLLGAGAAQRDRASARPTVAERTRATRACAAAAARLGTGEAEREQRVGRALRASAVRELVARVVGDDDRHRAPAAGLTARQLEVAALVAAGRTNRQIGRELGISEKTAELHVRNTMQRLGAPNRAGVAAWVVANPP